MRSCVATPEGPGEWSGTAPECIRKSYTHKAKKQQDYYHKQDYCIKIITIKFHFVTIKGQVSTPS